MSVNPFKVAPCEDDTEGPSPASSRIKKRRSLLTRILLRASTPSSSALPEPMYRESSLPPLSHLELRGYKESTKHRLLDEELAGNIRLLLPPRLQLFDEWELVYSLEQHGISLNTLYQNCNPAYQLQQKQQKRRAEAGFGESVVSSMVVGTAPSHLYLGERGRPQGYVMVVQDTHNDRFGCYLNENLKPMDQRRYYGNGECFLWKCERYDAARLDHSTKGAEMSGATEHNAEADVGNEKTGSPMGENGKRLSLDTPLDLARFKAFMYTGINDNVIFSNHDFISVGSSDGHNGLWIDKSLYHGVSCACDTFGNEVLSGSRRSVGKFKVAGLELWRVGTLE